MANKTYFINQLEKGQVLDDEIFGINQIKRATDRNNKPYVDLEFIDKTGTIKAKIWSDSLERIENSALSEGSVVSIKGTVGEFNGNLQLTIHEVSNVDDYDIGDFLLTTTKDIDELWEELEDRVDDLADSSLKKLLEKLMQAYEEELRKAPAARGMHHHFVGGLLEHVVEMLKISDAVLDLYPEADKSLVTAGIVFHDIGKIKELQIDGFRITYSKEGQLIGHIPLGLQILNNLDENILHPEIHLQLAHIILSHHFIRDFGSPVTPGTIEAMIVAKIDDLSAKVRQVQKVLETNKDNPSDFAPREFGIENVVYLPKPIDKN